MTATERREEIMKILVARRYETMSVLAAELGMTTRTIRSDVLKLTAEYPLETTRGNGGGVSVPNDYCELTSKTSKTGKAELSREKACKIQKSAVYS